MSRLQSAFISLLPLTIEQVELQVNDPKGLEASLSLNSNEIELSPEMQEEMRRGLTSYTIPKLKEHPSEHEWFTSWIIIHRADNKYIGAVGVGGPPNESGEVLIGYFVDKKYDGRGHATAATRLFIDHLFKDERLQQIAATIPIGHTASERVVEKNGFSIGCQLEEDGMALNKWVLPKTSWKNE